jgi:hypothetical protein
VARSRHPIGETLISIGALTLLLAVLVSVDDRVRQQVSLRFTGGGAAQAQLRGAETQVHNFAVVLLNAARYQSVEHAPMMTFVAAACVLFFFMIRT